MAAMPTNQPGPRVGGELPWDSETATTQRKEAASVPRILSSVSAWAVGSQFIEGEQPRGDYREGKTCEANADVSKPASPRPSPVLSSHLSTSSCRSTEPIGPQPPKTIKRVDLGDLAQGIVFLQCRKIGVDQR